MAATSTSTTTKTPGADATPPVAEEPRIKTYTVAPRRSFLHDGVNIESGGTVDLDPKEGKRFQDLGFFTADDGTVTISNFGPATVAGVEIKEQA